MRPSSRELRETPRVDRSPQRFLKAKIPPELSSDVRIYIADAGRGLLKAPMEYSGENSVVQPNFELGSLPPVQIADILISQYEQGVQMIYPVLHWPSILACRQSIYGGNPPFSIDRSSVAVFFAVLACGSLFDQSADRVRSGRQYLAIADSLDGNQDILNIKQAAVALLGSFFLIEVNDRPAAWRRLGSAIRLGQDLSLHVSGGQWSATEGGNEKADMVLFVHS